MSINFLEIQIPVGGEMAEILIAELSEIGFGTFQEESHILKAYIPEDDFREDVFNDITEQYGVSRDIQILEIEKKNWNEEWEKNYHPVEVIVDGQKKIRVRASFHHDDPDFEFQIVINPKMSFGTGHHETTYQMLKTMLTLNFDHKSIIDLGTGTGVLAIMSKLLGASQISAYDIDEWCVENGNENFDLNNVECKVELGSARSVPPNSAFDITLANINRNVLLDEMNMYSQITNKGGLLLLSGFYEQDLDPIKKSAHQYGFEYVRDSTRNRWATSLFERV